jgi:isochorismate hydrolase
MVQAFIRSEDACFIYCSGMGRECGQDQAQHLSDEIAESADRYNIPKLIVDAQCALAGELISDLRSTGRNTLLLAGAWLESEVTWVAISTLLEGFDVFVIFDQTFTQDEDSRPIFLERIRGCGGTLVSFAQVERELGMFAKRANS